ncbi:MAG: S8 family serine peptidase [Lachnospiraceae bacterium]|nr:S8 family serine peptidase [Lachnospiraceae bacterium]
MEFSIGPGENSLSLQIWKEYVDEFQIALEAPNGEHFLFPEQTNTPFRYQTNFGEILYYNGGPTPFTIKQPIFIEWISSPTDFVESGTWTLFFSPKRIILGTVNLWFPTIEAIGKTTGFFSPNPDITLTIPSTAGNVITVGAYRTDTDSIAPFSGRGNTADGRIKPTLVAPGVNVITTIPGGGYGRKTGTSIAAPFVTGSAALLMEWGIVRGNDPFLY